MGKSTAHQFDAYIRTPEWDAPLYVGRAGKVGELPIGNVKDSSCIFTSGATNRSRIGAIAASLA